MPTIMKDGDKVYIEGVRRVSWDTGEMCEFAASLVSAMRCLGETIPYEFVMGTSGVAFRFTLTPGAWEYGDYSIQSVSAAQDEAILRAFKASGYTYEMHEKGSMSVDSARMLASLERGIPVLAFGVVGPSDCCILTGYDEGGEVLLGWSTYQDIQVDHDVPPDSTGYFRKPGWHDHLRGYVLTGAKIEPPARRELYLEALKWAVYLLCTPRMGNRSTGLAAMRLWAEELTQVEHFPPGDEQLLSERYLATTIRMTMLRDHCSAEPFLRQAAQEVPDFQPYLSKAADCYREVKSLRRGMDDLINDNFSEDAFQAFKQPQKRRAYTAAILQICEQESQAASHLERLIQSLNHP